MTARSNGSDDARERREHLVERLRRHGYVDRESTAEALRTVPRHEFVAGSKRHRAYEDRPLPIGDDQTVSAPHMVAIVTDLLELEPGDRVLEIGTGCGYHAAVTAAVVGGENVYSVEYSEPLAEAARRRLAAAGYGAVSVDRRDGHRGWPEHEPYDGAYLTCATPTIPDSIVRQVRPDGVIVAPVGAAAQTLVRLTVGTDGIRERERHGRVRFVPMRGDD